jgi:predicted nucleic acid-binding protein
MITAVDTNVLVDVFKADSTFGPRSAEALQSCLDEGSLVACDIVWAETGTVFVRHGEFLEAMLALGIGYSPTSRDTSLVAARAWRLYRTRGGQRQRVVADFLIGAHALQQADRLLTRDRGFYRDYFEKLRIIDPTEDAL